MEPPENQLQLVVSSNSSAKSLQDLLYSQKEMFFTQVDDLKNIVLTQCNLTGVNPLSQEMAAGALSIKIGKRPRDLLNPKAIKYMQSIFSIKDVIGKKEVREISALFGVTATQVKEFFTSQRSRVRKFVRSAQEKANISSCKQMQEQPGEIPVNFDPSEPLNPVPLDTVAPISVEEGPTCSKEDEFLLTVDESDKHFVENIFNLMRKEETFSGQVKLMEWILQIQNHTVLFWFLTKGGIMILATWLSQAVVEEQTSVLHAILKVLCHLPLQKALPIHLSAVLQSVNRLRFYRASDISNRARILLSRWSKAFARSQALKKSSRTKSTSDTQDEMLLKQSIDEVMGNGSWDSKIDFIEDGSTPLGESPGNLRKLESQPLKLLTASSDDTNKKLISGDPSQGKARRKVLLVEQPCQKSTGRSSQVGRPSTTTRGRPLSADDIQKAKMRAQFMQSRYGKSNTSATESSPLQLEAANRSNSPLQLEAANKSNSPQMSILHSAPKAHIEHIIEEPKKSEAPPLIVSYPQDPSINNKMVTFNSNEPPQKKCKRMQIPWHTPPEIIVCGSWRVGNGENSKEVEVQKHRIHRERETIYNTVQEIPSNPQEPWDREIDYDDSLTPQIPTEQLPDADGAEAPITAAAAAAGTSSSSQSAGASGLSHQPEPDMELLAVLLKNPELVFALTSSQAGNLSSEETMKLLDMIKANDGLSSSSSSGSLSVIGGNNGKAQEMVEVSLPSPTPSSNPVTTGWKADLTRNPFSQEAMNNHEMHGFTGIAAHSQQSIPASNLLQQPHIQSGTMAQTVQQFSLLQSALGLQEQQRLASAASSSHHMQLTVSKFEHQTNTMRTNSSMQVEAAGIVNPSALPSLAYNQMQQTYAPEPQVSQSWRPTTGQIPHYQNNLNPNNYNSFAGGGHMRNDLADETDYESWNPHNSPGRRSHRYNNNSQGWNMPESRLNPGYGYRSDRPISRNFGYRDPGRGGGNQRWNDRSRQ